MAAKKKTAKKKSSAKKPTVKAAKSKSSSQKSGSSKAAKASAKKSPGKTGKASAAKPAKAKTQAVGSLKPAATSFSPPPPAEVPVIEIKHDAETLQGLSHTKVNALEKAWYEKPKKDKEKEEKEKDGPTYTEMATHLRYVRKRKKK